MTKREIQIDKLTSYKAEVSLERKLRSADFIRIVRLTAIPNVKEQKTKQKNSNHNSKGETIEYKNCVYLRRGRDR